MITFIENDFRIYMLVRRVLGMEIELLYKSK